MGGYKANDPSIHIDAYPGATNYKVPGPALWGNAAPITPVGYLVEILGPVQLSGPQLQNPQDGIGGNIN